MPLTEEEEKEFQKIKNIVAMQPFYHEGMSLDKAKERLLPTTDGPSFLIRFSRQNQGFMFVSKGSDGEVTEQKLDSNTADFLEYQNKDLFFLKMGIDNTSKPVPKPPSPSTRLIIQQAISQTISYQIRVDHSSIGDNISSSQLSSKLQELKDPKVMNAVSDRGESINVRVIESINGESRLGKHIDFKLQDDVFTYTRGDAFHLYDMIVAAVAPKKVEIPPYNKLYMDHEKPAFLKFIASMSREDRTAYFKKNTTLELEQMHRDSIANNRPGLGILISQEIDKRTVLETELQQFESQVKKAISDKVWNGKVHTSPLHQQKDIDLRKIRTAFENAHKSIAKGESYDKGTILKSIEKGIEASIKYQEQKRFGRSKSDVAEKLIAVYLNHGGDRATLEEKKIPNIEKYLPKQQKARAAAP